MIAESASEAVLQSEKLAKVHTDDESEVPLPPGTEPLLPIPSAQHSSDKDKKEKEDDHPKEKHHRERRRSYSRDNHRER